MAVNQDSQIRFLATTINFLAKHELLQFPPLLRFAALQKGKQYFPELLDKVAVH